MSKNNVLVTGGNGFIGSHVVDLLLDKKFPTFVVDNLFGSNFGQLIHTNRGATNIYGDVSNYRFLSSIIEKNNISSIIHLAANANVPLSHHEPQVDFQYNAKGTFNVLDLAVKHKVKKVIFASSAAIYGEPQYTPIDEQHPLEPISNYGVTKLYGEKLGFAYCKTYSLNFTAIRIFNTYGPRQPRYVLYDLLLKLKRDSNFLEVLGTGEQIRDYNFVKDTAKAFLLALESEKSAGQAYNLSGGNPISIKQLVEMTCSILNLKPAIRYTGESWAGDIKTLIGAKNKISDQMGWSPEYSIEQGLTDTIRWFKANNYL